MICSANSNIGMKRTLNEDTVIVKKYTEKTCLCVVCDGMGGANAGEEASSLAAKTFVKVIDNFLVPYIGSKEKSFRASDVKRVMSEALYKANERVHKRAKGNPDLQGMGTTIVAALVINKTVFCLNVGDSRLYILNGTRIKQVTKDHSYVQYLIDLGRITPEEAETSANKNIITRAVGTEQSVRPDIFIDEVEDGSFLLLCSDGLYNFVDEAAMCDIVSSDPSSRRIDQIELDKKTRRLIDTANNNGGLDNITVAVVKI